MSAAVDTGVDKMRQQAADRKREEKQEKVELYGKAQELFDSRQRDSFTVERHDVEIEFLYPNPEVKREFKDERQRLIQKAKSGAGFGALLEESVLGVERMEEIMSEHAVDPSFSDPAVWRGAIGFNENEVASMFQDFITLGKGRKQEEQLKMLQSLVSETS